MISLMYPSSLAVTHRGQTGDGPSAAVWDKLVARSINNGNRGLIVGDDFQRFQGFTNAISGTTALPSTTVPAPDGYQIYVDSATTASGVSRSGTLAGGVAVFAPGATDNHLAIINSGIFAEISRTAGEEKITAFECRMALNSQVASGSTFQGLATTSITADGGLIADAGGLLATGAGIGFRTKEDDADGIDAVFQAASQTEQVVKNVAQVAVADTFYNLGLLFDPFAPASKRISFFVNGVDVGSYVSDTDMAAATFPNSIMLAPTLAAMTQATTTRGMLVDWWYAGQVP